MTDATILYTLDCQQRGEKDPTKHLALCLRMAQEQHDAPPAFKARQDALMGRKPRIRVQALTA